MLIVDVVAVTDYCTISESYFRFTSRRHSSAACCRVTPNFVLFLIESLCRHSYVFPQTKIKYLDSLPVMDKILNRSHSLLTVPVNIVKSTVSYFIIFRQLNLTLKSEVCSLKICFKVSTVSAKLQFNGCLGRM